eukprot:Seg649.4 transcript_id=Seg649.4/GoldUCD/mRNA.D3Y31 product="Protein ANKUB1" protein_id=Seg649.4/GoldUCD/D3Y31
MKVSLLYGKKRMVVEIGENDTVQHLKEFFRDYYSLNLKSSGDTEDLILTISYAGAFLQDDWILSDIGILPGTVLQCHLKSRDKIFMRAYAAFNNKYYDFTNPIDVDKTTVADFKTMIQDISGLPVSMVRLYKEANGPEMFDSKLLDSYDVMLGDTIHIDIWDGMGDLLQSAWAGDVTATMNSIVSHAEDPALHKYQLRVALYIASFYGYIQLVSLLLKSGARCDDAIGEHPARDWCKDSMSHPLCLRTPAHAATQNGKISCLRLFIHHNRACILAKDGNGWTPTGVARRYQQRDCFKLLITEQFRTQRYSGLSLSMYGKVRKWCDRARDRVGCYKTTDPLFPVLLASTDKTGHGAGVGSPIQLNGFGNSIQTSASKLNRSKIDAKNQWLWPRREELSDIAKRAGDRKMPRKYYRTLPSLRKQQSFKAKGLLRRSSSLESRGSVRSNGKSRPENNEKPRLKARFSPDTVDVSLSASTEKLKLHRTVSEPAKELQCKCSDCRECSCGGAVHLPQIHKPVMRTRKVSNQDSFFITQDGKKFGDVIHEETEQKDVIAVAKEEQNGGTTKMRRSPRGVRNTNKALTEQAHSVIKQATGQTSKELAMSSLEVGDTFTAMGWLRRLHLATNYNKKTLLRRMRDRGQSLTKDSCAAVE